MAGSRTSFIDIHTLNKEMYVGMPDGTMRLVKEARTVQLTSNIKLKNVLLIPEFKHNLLSVGRLIEQVELKIEFSNGQCFIEDLSSGRILARGKKVDGIYVLCFNQDNKEGEEKVQDISSSYSNGKNRCVFNVHANNDVHLLHQRIGHCSLSKLKHIPGYSFNRVDDLFCDACCLAKHHKLPFPLSTSIAQNKFELLHVDLWGPYRVKTITGQRYFLTILDDFSRATWTYLIKSKTEVASVLKKFLLLIENHFNVTVKIIRSDNGTGIIQEECKVLFGGKGILHQRSAPRTPQQNGRVERNYRHLVETARAMRLHAGLPNYFWGECILAATHIINLLPSRVIEWKTPHEKSTNDKPKYDHLRVMGCLCYIPNEYKGDKFAAKAKRCILLGYPTGQKAYRLYDLTNKKGCYLSRSVF
ncbi:Retrovirus-related Pol polyprotein from transposon RE1 [Bienertia sinuspersici]